MGIGKNSPDVILELTNEQATFLLENCSANTRLCLQLIVSIADEKGTLENKRKRSEPIVEMSEKFNEIRKLLRKSGAMEKED